MAATLFTLFVTFAVFHSAIPKSDFARLQLIKPWDVTITDNGYNVLIGISEEIPESQGHRLIESMKTIMTSASAKLHNLTEGRASFHTVTIVVPNSWTGYTEYSNGETVNKANVFIRQSDSSNRMLEVQEYLKGSKKPYRAIILPSLYIIENARDDNVGYIIVEKWFQLQYGITKSYNGILKDFTDTRHCSYSTGKNSFCQRLRTELDFKVTQQSSQPTFSVVRERSKRVVMIVDVSGSMYSFGPALFRHRLDKAKAGLKQYIKEEEDDSGTSLGLVQFSIRADTMSNLTNSRTDKEKMVNLVETLSGESGTSIGAGLKEALNVLKRHPEKTNGAEFILLSDGKEVVSPYIRDISPEIIRSSVTVHTIAITDEADTKMDALGAATGGLTFIHKDNEAGNDLGTAFSSISRYDEADPASSGILIFSERKTTNNPSFTILIDKLVGRDTAFVFECPHRNCELGVSIDSPDQQNFLQYEFFSSSQPESSNKYNIKPNSRVGQLDIVINDAKAGSWNVRTRYNNNNQNNRVLGLTVKTYPRDISNYPILAFSFWGKDQIFADECADDQTMYTLISRDNNPVVQANVEAVIKSDTDVFGPYRLYDDGKGRDNAENDGIYTGVFPKEIRNGTKLQRFKLEVKVNGTTATLVKTRQLVAVSNTGNRQSQPQDAERVQQLQRFVVGGSFISVKQVDDPCNICNLDLVILFHSPTQLSYLKSFVYGITLFFSFPTTEAKARVKIAIVDARSPDEAIVTLDEDPTSRFTPYIPDGGQADIATGLRTAGRLFNNDDRKKVIALISDTDTNYQIPEARTEADRLRSKGVLIIPVGVSGVPGFLTQIAENEAEILRVQTYLNLMENTQLINKACGFTIKKNTQP